MVHQLIQITKIAATTLIMIIQQIEEVMITRQIEDIDEITRATIEDSNHPIICVWQ